jgi:hypothetical protein
MTEHFRPPPFHPNRPGLVAPVRLDRSGRTGPTRGQAKGSQWRRSSHGFFVPSDIDATKVEQRIVEAAAVIPPGGGAVTGWAALCWLGGTWFRGTTATGDPLPVDLAMWSNIKEQQGIALCRERLRPDQVTEVDGLLITIPVRSVAFAMRYAANVRHAVAAFDMAAFNDLVSGDELFAYAGLAPRAGLSGWTGIPACRKATSMVDENSWSPQEVATRLVWQLDAGLPRPLTNPPGLRPERQPSRNARPARPGRGSCGRVQRRHALGGSPACARRTT